MVQADSLVRPAVGVKPAAAPPNPILNHKDTKNTKQTELTSVLTLFVS